MNAQVKVRKDPDGVFTLTLVLTRLGGDQPRRVIVSRNIKISQALNQLASDACVVENDVRLEQEGAA